MKKLLFICFLTIILASSFVMAQVKGDNLIIIETNRSPEENFNLFGKHLIEQGYSFESKDIEFFTIRTNLHSTKSATVKYRLNISFAENLIYIRPEVESRGLQVSQTPINFAWVYANSSISVFKIVYEDFNLKLRRYNYKIVYKKE